MPVDPKRVQEFFDVRGAGFAAARRPPCRPRSLPPTGPPLPGPLAHPSTAYALPTCQPAIAGLL